MRLPHAVNRQGHQSPDGLARALDVRQLFTNSSWVYLARYLKGTFIQPMASVRLETSTRPLGFRLIFVLFPCPYWSTLSAWF